MSKDVFGKLNLLKRGGSTSRVIDLVSIRERHGQEADWARHPMFRNARLNRSFIVKHTLRAWEREELGGSRTSATKVIIPISDTELAMGGHSIFVEHPRFESQLAQHLGVSVGESAFASDVDRLRSLALLPSFDPYLLHEYFRRRGDKVAPCYFVISDDELRQITEFVASQIDLLVRKAMGKASLDSLDKSRRLAKVLFEDEDSPQLAVLRDALRMTAQEYRDGVFGWKGTLYYSWRAGECYADLAAFIKDLKGLRIPGLSAADRAEIEGVTRSIGQLSARRWARLKSRLNEYNEEFTRFVERGDPAALKAFMSRAPQLFVEMGEDIGRLQHVSSYWRFWTRGRRANAMTPVEAFDLLPDFEAALMVTDLDKAA
ncbi:hypothetical protein F1654_05630 [Alkalicaulis satelles]|uniref:Uncharacterized protein n=1 Tax=Alkalicaulis satelles TaxID=2609175 RepID=A0A5M6ZP13_9PROT|nr:hypothetical protein [Alkalicaulis satelles]KAA5805457.1 hypothetical protein F1654_05630 [Alkalicaulis satelles]